MHHACRTRKTKCKAQFHKYDFRNALLPLKGSPTLKKRLLFQGFVSMQGRQCTYLHRAELNKYVLCNGTMQQLVRQIKCAFFNRARGYYLDRLWRDIFEKSPKIGHNLQTCEKVHSAVSDRSGFPQAKTEKKISMDPDNSAVSILFYFVFFFFVRQYFQNLWSVCFSSNKVAQAHTVYGFIYQIYLLRKWNAPFFNNA